MSIIIKRSTGWAGKDAKMHIIVNGKKLATINDNEKLEIELPAGENFLKVRQFGTRSNELEVRDGDILEVEYRKYYQMILPLMILISFFMSVILLLPYKSAILPLHILFVVISFATEGFHIKKIKK